MARLAAGDDNAHYREHIVWPILEADGATQMGRQAEGPEEV